MKSIYLLSFIVLLLAACDRPQSVTGTPPASAVPQAYPLDVCLVSGKPLGSMGEPHVIVHEGREIKFCCDHCEPKFHNDSQKYLPQLATQ